MNELLATIYRTGVVHTADDTPVKWAPTGTLPQTAAILHRLVTDHGFERTLETGFAYGLSALAICQAHANRGRGSHIAIDPKESTAWKNIGVLNVERAGLQRWLRFIEAPSADALPHLIRTGERVEFAFIDGGHLFDFALVDLFLVDQLLEIHGLVVFDDVWMPSVRRVVSFAITNRAYEVVTVAPTLHGLRDLPRIVGGFLKYGLERDPARLKFRTTNVCVLRKTREDDRKWDFHRAF
jgi:predicted O-methyltransferase YrrM